MAYVYRHIRGDKNEIFYIGIGVGYRAWQKTHRNRYWKHIVAITDYEIEIIIDDITWEKAIEKEKEFIALYGRKDLGKGTLVNMTDGGEGMVGYITPDEVKRKISEKKKGINPRPIGWKMTDEGRRKMSVASKGNKRSVGRILSPATKKKISESLKGNPPTNNKPILMFTTKGALIIEYESANDAGRSNRCIASNVTAACRYRTNAIGRFMGFIWRYRSECIGEDGNILSRIVVPYMAMKLKRKPFKFPTPKHEMDYYLGISNILLLQNQKIKI